jgi:hypothetical protein
VGADIADKLVAHFIVHVCQAVLVECAEQGDELLGLLLAWSTGAHLAS